MRSPVRTNPAIIRAVLLDAEHNGPVAAARRAGIGSGTISKWRKVAAQHPGWPDDRDVAEWRENQLRHADQRAADQRYISRRYTKGLDKLTVDATGTRRRMQALHALGWTWHALGAELGGTKHVAWRLAHGHDCSTRGVWIETAERVAEVYERLSMTRPVGPSAERARRAAHRMGWPPPLAWDDIDDPEEQSRIKVADQVDVDPVVVLRILQGDVVPASHSERVEVVRRWSMTGRSLNELEHQTGWRADRYKAERSA